MDAIRVTYSTIDRYRVSRSFKTIEGARKFAIKWVGETPEISAAFNYAVSFDGIGKIRASIPVANLFPKLSSDRGEPAEEV